MPKKPRLLENAYGKLTSQKAIRFDAEDQGLLDRCIAHEKLTASDVLRRALRAYAKSLQLEPIGDRLARRSRQKE
jgi:hypothetical protein